MSTASSTAYGPQTSNGGDQVASAFDGAGTAAQHTSDSTLDSLSEKVKDMRNQAARATESTIAYVKVEPVKAVLLAAAVGALLMGLASLAGRSRRA